MSSANSTRMTFRIRLSGLGGPQCSTRRTSDERLMIASPARNPTASSSSSPGVRMVTEILCSTRSPSAVYDNRISSGSSTVMTSLSGRRAASGEILSIWTRRLAAGDCPAGTVGFDSDKRAIREAGHNHRRFRGWVAVKPVHGTAAFRPAADQPARWPGSDALPATGNGGWRAVLPRPSPCIPGNRSPSRSTRW